MWTSITSFILQNDKLADVIYCADWFNYSIKEQKVILSLLHMTQFNCVEIWIGIFAPLCIETGSIVSLPFQVVS